MCFPYFSKPINIRIFPYCFSHEKGRKNRKTVSCREYYCYKLQIRPQAKSSLLHIRHLLQQYVVDMYVKLETFGLDYFKNQEDEIRAYLL